MCRFHEMIRFNEDEQDEPVDDLDRFDDETDDWDDACCEDPYEEEEREWCD